MLLLYLHLLTLTASPASTLPPATLQTPCCHLSSSGRKHCITKVVKLLNLFTHCCHSLPMQVGMCPKCMAEPKNHVPHSFLFIILERKQTYLHFYFESTFPVPMSHCALNVSSSQQPNPDIRPIFSGSWFLTTSTGTLTILVCVFNVVVDPCKWISLMHKFSKS